MIAHQNCLCCMIQYEDAAAQDYTLSGAEQPSGEAPDLTPENIVQGVVYDHPDSYDHWLFSQYGDANGYPEAEENYYIDASPDRRWTWGRASELMTKEAAYVIKNEIEENEGGMYEACVRYHNPGSPLPQRKHYFSATED